MDDNILYFEEVIRNTGDGGQDTWTYPLAATAKYDHSFIFSNRGIYFANLSGYTYDTSDELPSHFTWVRMTNPAELQLIKYSGPALVGTMTSKWRKYFT